MLPGVQKRAPVSAGDGIIVVLDFNEGSTGRSLADTKVRYSWQFLLGQEQFRIDFTNSKTSGKKRIFVNGRLQHESTVYRSPNFQYSWPAGGHLLSIVPKNVAGSPTSIMAEMGQLKSMVDCSFELRIDGLPFHSFPTPEDVARQQQRQAPRQAPQQQPQRPQPAPTPKNVKANDSSSDEGEREPPERNAEYLAMQRQVQEVQARNAQKQANKSAFQPSPFDSPPVASTSSTDSDRRRQRHSKSSKSVPDGGGYPNGVSKGHVDKNPWPASPWPESAPSTASTAASPWPSAPSLGWPDASAGGNVAAPAKTDAAGFGGFDASFGAPAPSQGFSGGGGGFGGFGHTDGFNSAATSWPPASAGGLGPWGASTSQPSVPASAPAVAAGQPPPHESSSSQPTSIANTPPLEREGMEQPLVPNRSTMQRKSIPTQEIPWQPVAEAASPVADSPGPRSSEESLDLTSPEHDASSDEGLAQELGSNSSDEEVSVGHGDSAQQVQEQQAILASLQPAASTGAALLASDNAGMPGSGIVDSAAIATSANAPGTVGNPFWNSAAAASDVAGTRSVSGTPMAMSAATRNRQELLTQLGLSIAQLQLQASGNGRPEVGRPPAGQSQPLGWA